MTDNFDDLRPYTDKEIPAAMRRIVSDPLFPAVSRFVFPEEDPSEVAVRLLGFTSIYDFQIGVMYHVNRRIIEETISTLTFDGMDNIDQSERYLFVSNHRDIMLDSCLFQYILHTNGHRTSEITFGSNLMEGAMIIDIGKSNKMFRVERGGSIRDLYRASCRLSQYIRHTVTQKGESVWIAQRNGRTKDGFDRTEPGLIKMFGSSSPDRIQGLAELNIVPLSVSYEWETCDVLKALELYASRSGRYVKRKGEDLNSILTGIKSWKGAVNISVCPRISTDDLTTVADAGGDFFRNVAESIDMRINNAYRLYPNNYIARDILDRSCRYADRYTAVQRTKFEDRLHSLDDYNVGEPDVLCDIFLRIYANPVRPDSILT